MMLFVTWRIVLTLPAEIGARDRIPPLDRVVNKKYFPPNQGCQFFSSYNLPKRGKYTKWPWHIPKGHKICRMAIRSVCIPNGHKIDKMSIKFTNIFIARHSKNYQNWYFWLENIPSGNTEPNGFLLGSFSSPVTYSKSVITKLYELHIPKVSFPIVTSYIYVAKVSFPNFQKRFGFDSYGFISAFPRVKPNWFRPAELVSTGVARFFLVLDTKTWKNVPNEHKMYLIVKKYSKCL
jgi:hypothetical protein